jgi:pyruvate,water dikinase
MNEYIKTFGEIGIGDVERVGGKNSSLGEMFNYLASKGVSVPDGFATTAFTFEHRQNKATRSMGKAIVFPLFNRQSV